MSRSIIQERKECFICRALSDGIGEVKSEGLERHHIMFGYSSKDRDYSEHFGLWVWLCHEHHREGELSPHKSKRTNIALRKVAQAAFEQKHSHEEWMRIFRVNYRE